MIHECFDIFKPEADPVAAAAAATIAAATASE